MNKKISIFITILIVLIGVFVWQMNSFPEQSRADEFLDSLTGDLDGVFDPNDCEQDSCCIAYRGAMGYVEQAWSKNLDNLVGQNKPTSDMVDEAFENLRTYKCWLEYICRSVDYSSYAPPETVYGGGLTKKHLGKIPGCQSPEDMGLITTGDTISNFLKESWDLITLIFQDEESIAVNMEFPDTFFTNGGIPYFPQCMTDITHKNASPDHSYAISNYEQCMAILDSKFACEDNEDGLKNCTSNSIAFVKLNNALKRSHADQKARALENKLSSIITKMATMEMHAEYLKVRLENLDSLYACYPPVCT